MANEKRLGAEPARRLGVDRPWLLVTVFVWVAVLAVAIGDAYGDDGAIRLADEARAAAGRDAHEASVAAALAALELDPEMESQLALLLGHQLTWQERAGEAVPWYQRHLEHFPGDREGRLGLARALSWSGDLPAAAGMYRELRADDSSDLQAQLGVARIAAWSEHHSEAAREYARAREMDPDSGEATLGYAKAQNIRGRHREAERALEPLAESGDDEARVELARARWWMGESDRALATLTSPESPGAAELAAAILDDRRVRADIFWERWIDVDDQELQTRGASVERGLSHGFGLYAAAAHETVEEPGIDEIGATRFTLGGSWRADRRLSATLRGTMEDVGRSLRTRQVLDVGGGESVTGDEVQSTHGYWDGWITWTPRDWTRFDLGVSRGPVQTPRSRARRIHTDTFAASWDQRLMDRLVGRIAASYGRYSDDNVRVSEELELEAGPFLLAPTVVIHTSAGASRIDFEDTPDHGYYSPSSYDSFFTGGRMTVDLGGHVSLEGDLRVTSEREESGDRFGVAIGGGTIRWAPPGALGVSAFVRNSTSRFDTDAGYGRRGVGVSIFLAP